MDYFCNQDHQKAILCHQRTENQGLQRLQEEVAPSLRRIIYSLSKSLLNELQCSGCKDKHLTKGAMKCPAYFQRKRIKIDYVSND